MMLRHASGAVSDVEISFDVNRIPNAIPATVLEIEGTNGWVLLSAEDDLIATNCGQATTEHAGTPLLQRTGYPWHGSK